MNDIYVYIYIYMYVYKHIILKQKGTLRVQTSAKPYLEMIMNHLIIPDPDCFHIQINCSQLRCQPLKNFMTICHYFLGYPAKNKQTKSNKETK